MIAALELLPRFDRRLVKPGALRRALIAGSTWGIALTAGFAAMNAWRCGIICLPDIAMTAAISITTGIACIGPVAAFGKRAPSAS